MKLPRANRLLAAALAVLLASTAASAQLRLRPIADVPSCVHTYRSSLRFPGGHEAFDALYAHMDSVLFYHQGNVRMWHVGGSHVQAGFFSARMQDNFTTTLYGYRGEFGITAPLKMAPGSYDKGLIYEYTGDWDASMASRPYSGKRPRYGITGFGAVTSSPNATVSLDFPAKYGNSWSFEAIRVLGYASSKSVHPYVIDGTDTLQASFEKATSSWLIELPRRMDNICVGFHIPQGESFTLNGFAPLNRQVGFSYYASGVNGASLITWLDVCTDLRRDLALVEPHLAIFGLGINDSACAAADFDPERFKARYRKLIAMVQEVSPRCAFIFITNNDSYRNVRRGMVYNENAPAVQKAMYELAEEYNGAVWDVYSIMGGRESVDEWCAAGLVGSDRLHFTKGGYNLLGDMLYNAIVEDFSKRRIF